jgi:hypothetical protein
MSILEGLQASGARGMKAYDALMALATSEICNGEADYFGGLIDDAKMRFDSLPEEKQQQIKKNMILRQS